MSDELRSTPGGATSPGSSNGVPANRKERGGFNPNRLGQASRPSVVIPKIVGGGVMPRPAAPPAHTSLVPPASPARRALEEAPPRAEPKGYTDVRIVGVGGGGGNAINRMIEAGVSGVEFIVANTDQQALEASQALTRMHLGSQTSRRLGAGGDPAVGIRAAEDSIPEIEDAIGGADMVFITAGMGGGTGTGGAPVIAQIARRLRALTVGVVTLPFAFEGARRRRAAEEGIARLRESVDSLIVIPNDRLLNISDRNTSVLEAFRRADDMLRHGVQGIADLVTVTGLINLDFADVRSVMEDSGNALMAIGEGNGTDRAKQAAESVVSSPLLEHSIAGASSILLNITGGPDLTLHEVSEISEFVTQAASADANIIFGAVIHPRPEAGIRVTLIATGMPEATASSRQQRPAPARREREPAPGRREWEPSRPSTPSPAANPLASEPPAAEPRPARPAGRETVGLPDAADPLDIPPFLRRLR